MAQSNQRVLVPSMRLSVRYIYYHILISLLIPFELAIGQALLVFVILAGLAICCLILWLDVVAYFRPNHRRTETLETIHQPWLFTYWRAHWKCSPCSGRSYLVALLNLWLLWGITGLIQPKWQNYAREVEG